jgi:hypothetical protein
VGRDNCHTCLVLEEYYRLKVNDYVLAAAAAPWSPLIGPVPISDDLCRAGSLTLEAARALLKHWKTCEECRRSKVALTTSGQTDGLLSPYEPASNS